MKVREVMHRGATWVTPDATVAEIARKMLEEDIGALPVGENDRLIGIVTDRDIVCRGLVDGGDPCGIRARDIMSKGVVFCREEDELEQAVDVMEKRKLRRLPVLDAARRMVGILSLGDVCSKAPTTLAGEMARAVSAHHA